jgi:hypothetical protein
MAKIAYRTVPQLEGLKDLANDGYLLNYSRKRNIRGGYSFNFSLSNQKICGDIIDIDFEKYHLEIVFLSKEPPKVYIRDPLLDKNTIHTYKDSSLCLYHYSEFEWNDTRSIAYDLIPWVYMWIYYYERWLEYGEWFGNEFAH